MFILFFPIKIKIYFSYINNSSFSLKLYNFSLLPKTKSNKTSKNKSMKKKSKKKKKPSFTKNLTPNNVYLFISNFNNRKFKPKFFLDFNLSYSLNDAKNTALLFGFIHTLFPFIFKIFSVLFKNSKPKLSLHPNFTNSFFVRLNGKCIITTSIGQIIYTAFILLKEFYKLRRCPK
ncbi:MAG: DUF2953 domain-containing protein [Clostridium sp.]